jgi:hypothetical protein
MSTDLSFDMNGDGFITIADVTDPGSGWLAVGGANNPNTTGGNPFLAGDADLSGEVDGSDFGVWNSNKFTSIAAWCSGDFNADGVVDGSDFGIWNSNKFQASDGARPSANRQGAIAGEPGQRMSSAVPRLGKARFAGGSAGTSNGQVALSRGTDAALDSKVSSLLPLAATPLIGAQMPGAGDTSALFAPIPSGDVAGILGGPSLAGAPLTTRLHDNPLSLRASAGPRNLQDAHEDLLVRSRELVFAKVDLIGDI